MLEIPESKGIADQITQTVAGKTICRVLANSSPHGFAFYYGDPKEYPRLLEGKPIHVAQAIAGQIEIEVDDARILLNDGVNIRFFKSAEGLPPKHQLLIEFLDSSFLVCTVQMYGGLWAFPEGQNNNPYYMAAKEKPSPLTDQFEENYFTQLFLGVKQTLSTKAFLATEQRIPGLGNGVLQDILFNARINPRTRLEALTGPERTGLFSSVKTTLALMTSQGGRDTEKDLFGQPGGYSTILSNKTLGRPCPVCGATLLRQSYLGGNVYFCPHCQPIKIARE